MIKCYEIRINLYYITYYSEIKMGAMLYKASDHIIISLAPVLSMASAPVIQGCPSTGIHTVYITAILHHQVYTLCC